MAVLFGWTYFFPSKKTDQTNVNTAETNANVAAPNTESQTNQPINNQPNQQPVASTPDNIPSKEITIKTPLYQVKLDSKGALATSWVLLKNISPRGEKNLYADGSNNGEQKPLELISQKALEQTPREIPFRLATGDQSTDLLINERSYQSSVNEDTVELGAGQTKQIDYVLKDEASGLEVAKTFIFTADSYVTDLQVKLTRNGQPIQNTKLLIGASVGDQGIKHHNYYHIEPEAVAFVNGGIERHTSASMLASDKESGVLAVNGDLDWAGVGDAYFAMAAIPSTKTSGLEYRSSKYETATEPFFDGIFGWITRREKTSEIRHLLTAYVPINADGSTTKIYTGTKDYFVLNQYKRNFNQT